MRRSRVRSKPELVCLGMAALCLLVPAEWSSADDERTLQQLTARIDQSLYRQCEADVRAWLDKRIADYGEFGVYEYGRGRLVAIEGDQAQVSLARGGIADAAAQFLRAYEMLGERKYLDAGLKTANLLIEVQHPAGAFPQSATVARGGKVLGPEHNPKVLQTRIQDGYQYRPFALLLYAHRLTGEKKYYDGARRCADWMIQIQHPGNGSCPDVYDSRTVDRGSTIADSSGVHVGGSYNDGATSDPARLTITMYHLTKDAKYLTRTARIGQWIFATQIGEGKVRGWCHQYGPDNRPTHARGFEMPVIDPRVFNRFTAPMLVWFYAATGEQRYRDLRLAQGGIDPETAASGGRGLEFMHVCEPWDVMGDWTTRAVKFANWFDLPLARFASRSSSEKQ